MRVIAAALAALRDIDSDADRACCVYAREVLRRTYGAGPIDAVPLALWHLWPESADPWGPVTAAGRAGIASLTSTPPTAPVVPAGRWALVQGWRGTPFAPGVTGHTFLWRAIDAEYGIRLDCAEQRWRPAPGPQLAGLLRWEDTIAGFHGGLAIAVLRPVVDLQSS